MDVLVTQSIKSEEVKKCGTSQLRLQPNICHAYPPNFLLKVEWTWTEQHCT
jgi:hypothetical protein